MKSPYKLISSEKVYSNPWFSVRKDHLSKDDKEFDYHVIEKNDAVFIIPITYDYKIVLIKLFRYPINKWVLELPAGSTDGEDPWVAAERELQEETGYKCKSLQKIAEFNIAPGLSNHKGHVFIARGLEQTNEHKQEEEGIVETLEVALEDYDKYILSGKIDDGPTVSALFYLRLFHEELKSQWFYIKENENGSEEENQKGGDIKKEKSHS